MLWSENLTFSLIQPDWFILTFLFFFPKTKFQGKLDDGWSNGVIIELETHFEGSSSVSTEITHSNNVFKHSADWLDMKKKKIMK